MISILGARDMDNRNGEPEDGIANPSGGSDTDARY